MTLVHGLSFDNLRGDVYGGLTAAVVALPLALAFGSLPAPLRSPSAPQLDIPEIERSPVLALGLAPG